MYYKWWIYQKVYLRELERRSLRKYLLQIKNGQKPVFIHINKTAGTSIATSLEIPEGHYTLQDFERMYAQQFKEKLPLTTPIYVAIRNPFDKVTSQYFYRIKTDQNDLGKNTISFDEWVKKAFDEKDAFYRDLEIMFMQQHKWLKSENEFTINFIRFENLKEEYENVAKKYNGKPLLWKKKSDNKNYKTLYSNYSQSVIAREFKEDLIRYNYSF